jgi:hypothetical protein
VDNKQGQINCHPSATLYLILKFSYVLIFAFHKSITVIPSSRSVGKATWSIYATVLWKYLDDILWPRINFILWSQICYFKAINMYFAARTISWPCINYFLVTSFSWPQIIILRPRLRIMWPQNKNLDVDRLVFHNYK